MLEIIKERLQKWHFFVKLFSNRWWEKIVLVKKCQNNFWKRILFLHVNGAQIWYIEAIKKPIETNNWDVETYRNKLEKILSYCTFSLVMFSTLLLLNRTWRYASFRISKDSAIQWTEICNAPSHTYLDFFVLFLPKSHKNSC